ncbi:MAG: ABC transporter substrate-binding protein [Alphaproteobacteria bacterium]|nr:ABC transporter substrate-binding protein [Alphaproteobacteria bacterium]
MIKCTLPFCAALFVNLIAAQIAVAAQTDAGEFVKSLGNHAIRVLTVKDISEAEREDRFRALLRQGFDVKRIGRFVLGRYARGVNKDAIDEYHGLFEDLIVATYAARFAEYTGQEFVIKRVARPKKKGDSIVMSEIRPSDGGPSIRIDWQVRGDSDPFKIVDVRVEGVSMSVTQREEFTAVIRQNGGKVDALIAILRKKTETLKSKQSSN